MSYQYEDTDRYSPKRTRRESIKNTKLESPTLSLLGRRPAVRRKHLKSGRRPRARSLAGGLWLVTEGYIRLPPLPPTLLLDRGDTPCRAPPDKFICILRWMFEKCSKTSFLTVFRGLRRPRQVSVVSVMRVARTGLIDISWVSGTC